VVTDSLEGLIVREDHDQVRFAGIRGVKWAHGRNEQARQAKESQLLHTTNAHAWFCQARKFAGAVAGALAVHACIAKTCAGAKINQNLFC
jgi:hypothetical protein